MVDDFSNLLPQAGFAGLGMGRLDEVIDQAKEVGAVARAHQLLGRLRLGFSLVKGQAAPPIRLSALARAERLLALAGNAMPSVRSVPFPAACLLVGHSNHHSGDLAFEDHLPIDETLGFKDRHP